MSGNRKLIIIDVDFDLINPYTVASIDPLDEDEVALYIWNEYVFDKNPKSFGYDEVVYNDTIDKVELNEFNPYRLFFVENNFYVIGNTQRHVGYGRLIKTNKPVISKAHNIDKYYSMSEVYTTLLSGLTNFLPSSSQK